MKCLFGSLQYTKYANMCIHRTMVRQNIQILRLLCGDGRALGGQSFNHFSSLVIRLIRVIWLAHSSEFPPPPFSKKKHFSYYHPHTILLQPTVFLRVIPLNNLKFLEYLQVISHERVNLNNYSIFVCESGMIGWFLLKTYRFSCGHSCN